MYEYMYIYTNASTNAHIQTYMHTVHIYTGNFLSRNSRF